MSKAIAIIISIFLITPAFAESILLKSGKTVEGKLIEKTDKYIKIDFQGVPLTYFFEDIESIDGQKPTTVSEDKKVNIIVTFDNPSIAIGYFKAAIEKNPNDFSAYDKLGMAYAELNQFQEAINCFQKAIEINTNFAEGYAHLGATYNSLEKPEEAIFYLKKAIDLGSNDIRTYASLGGSYYFTGKFMEAISYFEKVVLLDPKHIKAYLALANAYKSLGEYQKARENFLKLKELFKEQGDYQAVEEIEQMLDKLPK